MVQVDHSGFVHVVETGSRSATGTVPGAFDVSLDAQMRRDRLYVADGCNIRIQVFEITE